MKQPEEVEQTISQMQSNYMHVTGKPFDHFYCPLLFKDEEVPLCMGHVISKTLPNCCRYKVVQRADIDNWYGSLCEGEYGTVKEILAGGLREVVFNNDLNKKVRPTIRMGNKEYETYRYREGKAAPNHVRIELRPEDGSEVVRLVLVKDRVEMEEDQHKKWSIGFEGDWRPSVLVTVMKAANLTLFRLLGYGYAMSVSGLEIGRYTLGKFFEDNFGKPLTEVRQLVPTAFRQYRHMIRPVQVSGGEPPRGTIEDNRVGVAIGTSGKPFALLVWVRIDQDLFAVLMPGFNNVDSQDAYRSFLQENEDRWLNVSEGLFVADKGHWEVSDKPIPVFWPKKHESFNLE